MTVFQPVAEEVFLLKIFAEEQAENGITYVVVFNAFHLLLLRNQDFRILLNLVVGHGLHGQFLGDRNNNNTEENHED